MTHRLKPGDRVRFIPDETTKAWVAERDGGKVGVVQFVEPDGLVSVRFPHDNEKTSLLVHVDKLRRVQPGETE
jgi:hypothetical protein